MRVVVVGCGYVGVTTGACLALIGHQVTCYVIDGRKVDLLSKGRLPFFEPYLEELVQAQESARRLHFTKDIDVVADADAIFLAVATPSVMGNGAVDMRYVREAALAVRNHVGERGFQMVINKSTVPVGSNGFVEKLVAAGLDEGNGRAEIATVSNPEFLRKASAVTDFLYPDRIVVGTSDERAAMLLKELYRPIVEQSFDPPPYIPPRPAGLKEVPFIAIDAVSAELVKYAANAFLAIKISFINEIANICERVGADVRKVADGIGLDSRIGRAFLNAGVGWGGSCFGKDLRGLIADSREYGYEPALLDAVLDVNYRQRQLPVQKLCEVLKVLRGRTVAVLGLAFKPGTDDLRDAPVLDIIRRLLEMGCLVRVYDPVAIPGFQETMPELGVTCATDPYRAAQDADAIVLITEWEEFDHLEWERVKRSMRHHWLSTGATFLTKRNWRRWALSITASVSHADTPVSLISGAASFLGSHLVDRLLAEGHVVVGIDNLSTCRTANLADAMKSPRFTFVEGDVTTELDLPDLALKFIWHLSSPASPKYYRRLSVETLMVNSVGTKRLLDLALAHGAKFFLASTSEVYGDPQVHPQPEDYWGNVNPVGERACYDEGKRFAEVLTMEYHRRHDLDVRIARIFNTYGPRMQEDDGRAVPNFILQALRGQPLTIYGDGSQTRSFCYVDDLIDGLLRVVTQSTATGKAFNLGNPREYTVQDLAQLISDLCSVPLRVTRMPLPSDDPQRRRPDIAMAGQLLGWEPRIALREGLKRTIACSRELEQSLMCMLPEAGSGT